MQFPTVIGGVVPVVNIQGIAPGQLKLTGPVLGDIYLGKITKWNDPAITALNPGVTLPDEAITVVRRADGSGTTFIFTNYLSKVSPEWKAKVGEGTAVQVADRRRRQGQRRRRRVRAAPAELDRLRRVRLRQAEQDDATRCCRTRPATSSRPTPTTSRPPPPAPTGARRFYQVLTDQPGKDSLADHRRDLHPDAQGAGQAGAARPNALKFFDWAYANGDKMADELDYVPLPDAGEGPGRASRGRRTSRTPSGKALAWK